MIAKAFIALGFTFLAFAILFISVFRTASVKYEFTGALLDESSSGTSDVYIEYALPYHGEVLPDNPLWPLKAMRDRVWRMLTTDPGKKAELYLLFADKRLGASLALFENGKPEEGLVTLKKAEMYLQKATEQEHSNKENGIDTYDFTRRLAYASLKHQKIIEQILLLAPNDAHPEIIETNNYSISVYDHARAHLIDNNMVIPDNPFRR